MGEKFPGGRVAEISTQRWRQLHTTPMRCVNLLHWFRPNFKDLSDMLHTYIEQVIFSFIVWGFYTEEKLSSDCWKQRMKITYVFCYNRIMTQRSQREIETHQHLTHELNATQRVESSLFTRWCDCQDIEVSFIPWILPVDEGSRTYAWDVFWWSILEHQVVTKKTHPRIVLANWYNILICSSVQTPFPATIARKLLRLKGFIVLFLDKVGLFTLELSHDVFFLVS